MTFFSWREADEKFGQNKWLPLKTFQRWHLIKESRDSNCEPTLGGAIQGFIISLIEQQIRLILGTALSVPSSVPSNGLVGGMICSIYRTAEIKVKKSFFSPLFFWRCRYTSHNRLLVRNVCKSVDRDGWGKIFRQQYCCSHRPHASQQRAFWQIDQGSLLLCRLAHAWLCYLHTCLLITRNQERYYWNHKEILETPVLSPSQPLFTTTDEAQPDAHT